MTKFIGIKELQQNTKKIREEVGKGITFIVIYRSKPIFQIKPVETELRFADDMEATDLYKMDFIKKMKQAEEDINSGNVENFTSTEKFLKSLK